MKSRIDRSWGARSQKTSTSGWISPRLMRTESTKRMFPSEPSAINSRDLQHRRRIAVGVVGHEYEPPLAGGRDHLHAMGAAVRQRLFHKHVFSGPQGRQGY